MYAEIGKAEFDVSIDVILQKHPAGSVVELHIPDHDGNPFIILKMTVREAQALLTDLQQVLLSFDIPPSPGSGGRAESA